MSERHQSVGTDTKEASGAFVESTYLLEVAQGLAQVGSWVFELATKQVSYSRECYRICGLPYRSPVDRDTFYNMIHCDDRVGARARVDGALASGDNEYELECRFMRPDGTLRWVIVRAQIMRDEAGTPVRVLGIIQDITDHKLAIDELKMSKQRYRRIASVVEWSNDAILGIDLDGTIISWNRSATQLFGYTEAEIQGQPLSTIVPESLREEALRLLERAHAGEEIERYVTVRRRKDGTHVEIALTVSPIRGPDGVVAGYSSIARDLSEQRRAESALLRTEQQLREAQKMEAVGLLAGGVAHDFNNLLSVIVGYTELVLDSIPQDDPVRSDLLEVRSAGASAVTLTRQLLAFSRRQMLQPRVIDLNQIVGNLERMLRRLLGVRTELAFALNDELGRVSADPGQIEQVVMNLVINARDAMPDGGTVTVTSDNVELDDDSASALGLKAGPHVVLAIGDTGTGIDAATKARIFEPFFTTKEKGKGTGLGLPTALGIVQQSKGAIEVESEPGRGTTFRIYLPRTERPMHSAHSVPPSRVRGSGWETVLLVEDDDQVRALARTALKRSGYQVLEAEQGEQALQICQQFAGSIHLLLSDVVMPRMSGRELADRVAALRPDTKVLLMSGYASEDLTGSGKLSERFGILHKPITPANLTRKVREVLDDT